MEDEIVKHTKKIFKTVTHGNQSLGKKVKEIAIEIGIIVFAVTLSISLHNWSEHRAEQNEVTEFLNGLKTDLNKDIVVLERNRNAIAHIDSNYRFLSGLSNNESKPAVADLAIYKRLEFAMPVTHLNVGRYDGFKSSGKIGNIENQVLKENILAFYQQTLPELSYSESFLNSLELKILDMEIDKNDQTSAIKLVTSAKMRSLFTLAMHNAGVSINQYDQALKQAQTILDEIDQEVKD